MFANTQMMGTDLAFPDVCLTPLPTPTPIAYPNVAIASMGVKAVYHVLWACAPAHNIGTTIPLSNGDNAGIALGVASGTVMGPSRHLTGAFTVLVGGLPTTRLSSVSMQNSTNTAGMRITPSQVKVLVLAP